MIDSRSAGAADRPTYQWEAARGSAPLALRLFGTLGRRELTRIVDAMIESGGSPREILKVDFEDVNHLDYRALSEFTKALQRQRDRGASIWFVGLSPYLRALFHVAGQGPALNRLEWRVPELESASFARRPAGIPGAAGEAAWGKTRY
jgi:ABC-type transporter Mla MlaB component